MWTQVGPEDGGRIQSLKSVLNNSKMDNVLQIVLTCWARSGDVMCFLWGTKKRSYLMTYVFK
jgi:hypothetical protein